MKFKCFLLTFIALFISNVLWAKDNSFDFKRQLFDQPSSLFLFVAAINPDTGEVTINGGDAQQPDTPFTWDWGDGNIHNGWFPQVHKYSDNSRNYIVKVTANYPGGKTDLSEILVRFVKPIIANPINLPSDIIVSIPDHKVNLVSRMPGYGIPGSLTYFDENYFHSVSRSTVEYILSIAAWIQKDFTNDNIFLINGGFNQILMRDPNFGGMYSLWYTSPVCFGVADYGFQGTIQYSSFMHEMGHNFTLNSPADYFYGGKIDGNANTIFSESMAQIYQHATAYEIVNNYKTFGLSEDIAFEIKQSAISSIQLIRNSYENYINSGMNFFSWNNPNTPQDETFETFMTIAYKFCAYAENTGSGYRMPLKRMMMLLQMFDEKLRQRYDQNNNTPEADKFRATLMVTALSYAFSQDLRTEFRNLNFPISDEIYTELMNKVKGQHELEIPMKAGWNMISCPGEPLIKDINTLLANSPSISPYVYTWDPVGGGYIMVTRIEFGIGYWFAATEDTTLKICYIPRSSMSRPVKAGWNMVCSLPCKYPVSKLPAMSNPVDAILPFVYTWDPVKRGYVMLSNIEPGMGLWVASIEDAIMNLDCASAASGKDIQSSRTGKY